MTNQHTYLYKTNIFGPDSYDNDHRKYATFQPGFKLLEMPGASLNVVAILNRSGSLDNMEDLMKQPFSVATTFYKSILNKAIEGLGLQTKTRQSNLAVTARLFSSPSYYKLYKEDLTQLARNIKDAMKAIPSNMPFKYFFVYFKLGQQHPLFSSLTLRSSNLDTVMTSPLKIEYCCCHVAVNFSHTYPGYSVFWDREKTAVYLRGKKVAKYPLMGLGEIGNITSKLPRSARLLSAWPRAARNDVDLAYIQAYTPLTNAMETTRPFADHPFLLSYLLGRDYIHTHKEFAFVEECLKGREYRGMQEAMMLQLRRSSGRFELVVTSRNLFSLFSCNLNHLAHCVSQESLLVQVC